MPVPSDDLTYSSTLLRCRTKSPQITYLADGVAALALCSPVLLRSRQHSGKLHGWLEDAVSRGRAGSLGAAALRCRLGIEVTTDVAMLFTDVVRRRLGEEGNQQPSTARSLPIALTARSADATHKPQRHRRNPLEIAAPPPPPPTARWRKGKAN
jgi:hypothetical protein